jgi:hypothetical protein
MGGLKVLGLLNSGDYDLGLYANDANIILQTADGKVDIIAPEVNIVSNAVPSSFNINTYLGASVNSNRTSTYAVEDKVVATLGDIPGPTNLDGLTDVVITGTPTNQQLIVYNTSLGVWENRDPIVASGLAYKELYPNTRTATGQLGQISIDATNGTMYVCTGTNSWQKISLNSANFTNTGGFD